MTDLGVGIIGCGNISKAYLNLAPLFNGIEIRACADIDMKAAQALATQFAIRAHSVDELLSADDIDIVVNLTVPDAHWPVSREILSAGKHVYSEKPLVLTLEDGLAMHKLADEQGVRVGSAPDTFLGGAHQRARKLIDDGELGEIVAGSCHVMSHGMEHWHPNPDFFFKPGGGPMLDLGPYYLANLINLIGPVKRVAALANASLKQRTISSKPRAGEKIDVETPTNIHALLEFHNGATITFSASWDIWAHEHNNMELYGSEATLYVPDPNFFSGELRIAHKPGEARIVDDLGHPLGIPNEKHAQGMMANYRTAGLADMALAIREGRDHRCSLDLALHAVDVMTAILKSGETGEFVETTTTCSRPEPFGIGEAKAMMR